MRSGSTPCRARQISLPALKPWYKKFKEYSGNLSAGHFYYILSVIGWSVCRGIPEGLAIAHTHPFTRLTPVICIPGSASGRGPLEAPCSIYLIIKILLRLRRATLVHQRPFGRLYLPSSQNRPAENKSYRIKTLIWRWNWYTNTRSNGGKGVPSRTRKRFWNSPKNRPASNRNTVK